MKTICTQTYQGRSVGSMATNSGVRHIPGSGQPVEEKVMFVFGSVLFVALMAYGAAMNVLLGSDAEDTFI